ncbi:hypothetical protein FQN54_000890 [Arachnomyces sp. PD_36]|nr:hypothetical protein FQN54_000890 [Arachnomyces sp. PD_36]
MASKSQELVEKCSTTQGCFVSEPWKLKIANSNTVFYIHEDLLKKSSPALYSVCERHWAETQERVYRFDSTVPEQVIPLFLSYAYCGDYSMHTRKADHSGHHTIGQGTIKSEVIKRSATDSNGNNDDNDDKGNLASTQTEPAHPLLLHIQLYVFADAYIMTDLQKLSRQKIREHLKSLSALNNENTREMVLDLLEYAFDNLREEDIMLTLLSLYASYRLGELRQSSQRLESLMLGSGGKFFRHFLPKITTAGRDAFSYDDEGLASYARGEGFHNSRS